jgi:hypothetical protein
MLLSTFEMSTPTQLIAMPLLLVCLERPPYPLFHTHHQVRQYRPFTFTPS